MVKVVSAPDKVRLAQGPPAEVQALMRENELADIRKEVSGAYPCLGCPSQVLKLTAVAFSRVPSWEGGPSTARGLRHPLPCCPALPGPPETAQTPNPTSPSPISLHFKSFQVTSYGSGAASIRGAA